MPPQKILMGTATDANWPSNLNVKGLQVWRVAIETKM